MVGGSFAVRGFGSDLGFWAGCQRCPVFCLPPVRYGAIREALRTLSTKAIRLNASVHMPRIGAGLAGGEWKEIERIIAEELCSKLNSVSVYDLPK
jgi:O-acetyl-ADP-ribose deacetylase (regulator of RNase III)